MDLAESIVAEATEAVREDQQALIKAHRLVEKGELVIDVRDESEPAAWCHSLSAIYDRTKKVIGWEFVFKEPIDPEPVDWDLIAKDEGESI